MTFVDIQKFIDAFCSFHPAVQFTFDIGKKVSFLDISISVESENLVTTVYYKPTDSHSYLHYKSNHSRACKDAIPYSQFLRLRRLCSDDNDFDQKCKEMCVFFLSKDYPLAVVSKCLEKAKHTSRNDLLHNDTSSKLADHKLPLILDFNSYNCKVMSIVKNNFFAFLSEDEDIGKMFENNIVCSYSNERSLSKYLVRSKLTFDNEIPGTFRCNRPVCNTCDFVSHVTVVTGTYNSFYIRRSFTCTSENVVYCIICSKCGHLYIGETGRRLGDRFREHLSDIRNKRIERSDVAKHFNLI